MKQFTDNNKQTWDVVVDTTTIKRVRSLANVDLLSAIEGKLIPQLIADPILLVDVVFVVCKPQADERGIDDEAFGKAMYADAIADATEALLEEIVAFCPSPRDRKNLGQVLKKTNQVLEKTRDLIEQKLNSGELERLAEKALAEHGDSSGSAPESSESIRDP